MSSVRILQSRHLGVPPNSETFVDPLVRLAQSRNGRAASPTVPR